MIKWLKNRTKPEKWMLAMIVILLIAVVTRWGFIKKEAGDAIRHRIEYFNKPDRRDSAPARDSLPKTDSAGWHVVRDTVGL